MSPYNNLCDINSPVCVQESNVGFGSPSELQTRINDCPSATSLVDGKDRCKSKGSKMFPLLKKDDTNLLNY